VTLADVVTVRHTAAMDAEPLPSDGRVALRRWQRSDAAAVRAMCADELSQRWTVHLPSPYTLDDAVRYVAEIVPAGWATRQEFAFAVTDAANAEVIGSISLRDRGDGIGEVGYLTAPAARGQGVATAALRLMVGWGFAELGLERIEWQAKVGNAASRRVAERAGFRVEGMKRGGLPSRGGGRIDGWYGALLRGDPAYGVPTEPLLPPRLITERLLLRPVDGADVDPITECCQDATIARWLPHLPSPYTTADAEAFVAGQAGSPWNGSFDLAVTERRTGRLVGMMGMFGYRRRSAQAEVGYWIDSRARGLGYATEGVRALAAWGLQEQGLHRVTLTADVDNTASRRVAEKAGFTEEGRARETALDRNGSWRSLVNYARVAGDVVGAASSRATVGSA
jgi:RimJ/RimL family protein N-acetyltransferase